MGTSDKQHEGNYANVTTLFDHPHGVMDSPKWVTDRLGTSRVRHAESGAQSQERSLATNSASGMPFCLSLIA